MAGADQPSEQTQVRVALRYVTSNVPGLPAESANRVASDFAIIHLLRSFTPNTDFIHLPCDFDSEEGKRIWVLCDFNIERPIDRHEGIYTESWKVSYDQEQ